MPIYEYHCKQCGEFEVMQRITDRALRRCPTCQKKVTKLISNTSFQLKGTGWYVTDYARKDGKSKDTAKDATTETAETKTETKTESTSDTTSKSESKSESKTSKTKSKEAAAA
jgi:putative FmdB family regulatory protein